MFLLHERFRESMLLSVWGLVTSYKVIMSIICDQPMTVLS